jgi:hypothetical protein
MSPFYDISSSCISAAMVIATACFALSWKPHRGHGANLGGRIICLRAAKSFRDVYSAVCFNNLMKTDAYHTSPYR